VPGGLDHPVVGFLTFTGVKLVGYTVAAAVLERAYERTPRRIFRIGAARTAIGVAAGLLYGLAWTTLIGPPETVPYLAGLFPVRLIEWRLLLWIFHDRNLWSGKGWRWTLAGTIWSYALDVPAVAGFFVLGGFWVC
jgi:hypothetical protein